MQYRKYCNPKDLVRFLLALCCQDDSSTTPVSRDEALDRRLDDCFRNVVSIANSGELAEKLEKYKSSSSTYEWDMYIPFAEAMNYALERLSNIEVDGLPEFETHIAFVPCNKRVQSDRTTPGTAFKPDIVIMAFQDACEFHELRQPDTPELSKFVDEIAGKSPSGLTNWGVVLSAIEIKRKKDADWVMLREFDHQNSQVNVIQDANQRLDEKQDDPQPTTAISSATLVSSKRSASVAGMSASGDTSGNKRQRVQKNKNVTKKATKTLAVQNGIYATEKFSDSFSISHVLNLLIENDCLWISWIDREGPILSSGCSFFENLPLMLVLLLVLQRFGRRQWGYISELDTESHPVQLHPINADGSLGEDEVAVDFYPKDVIHSSWALLGRATAVVGAKREDRGKDGTTKGEHPTTPTHVGLEGGIVGAILGQIPEDTQRSQEESGGNDSSPGDSHCAGIGTSTTDRGGVVRKEVVEGLGKEWDDYYKARDEYRDAHADIAKSHNLVLKVSWPETSRAEEWKVIKRAWLLGESDEFIRGHIPEVNYARDLNHYSTKHIRQFLGLQLDGGLSGARTLRLLVMNRLWPIHDLDGAQFWGAFWQCVACHYRLWMNGIHHGDISPKNLMYAVSGATSNPIGILNDFDLATWVDHPTTNSDRTGTIPFMAIDLLEGGLDRRVPRLYRHDMESFSWVLAYISVADIQYQERTLTIQPVLGVDDWFRDDNHRDRTAHVSSKRLFHLEYGMTQGVTGRYYRYKSTIRKIIQYWSNLHDSRKRQKSDAPPLGPKMKPVRGEQVSNKPEVDNASSTLESFANAVEELLGEEGGCEFTEVKALLLRAIGTTSS